MGERKVDQNIRLLLFQAGFIPQLPSTGLWALMVAIWFVSMLVTPRFYR